MHNYELFEYNDPIIKYYQLSIIKCMVVKLSEINIVSYIILLIL